MLKCKDCTNFTWGAFCRAHKSIRQACPSNGDETKCGLYPKRRRDAQERLEAELSRRVEAKWFDFDKQKPAHGDCVLGIDTEGNMEVYQYSEEWSSCLMRYDGNLKAFNITHWTALPKSPNCGAEMRGDE